MSVPALRLIEKQTSKNCAKYNFTTLLLSERNFYYLRTASSFDKSISLLFLLLFSLLLILRLGKWFTKYKMPTWSITISPSRAPRRRRMNTFRNIFDLVNLILLLSIWAHNLFDRLFLLCFNSLYLYDFRKLIVPPIF